MTRALLALILIAFSLPTFASDPSDDFDTYKGKLSTKRKLIRKYERNLMLLEAIERNPLASYIQVVFFPETVIDEKELTLPLEKFHNSSFRKMKIFEIPKFEDHFEKRIQGIIENLEKSEFKKLEQYEFEEIMPNKGKFNSTKSDIQADSLNPLEQILEYTYRIEGGGWDAAKAVVELMLTLNESQYSFVREMADRFSPTQLNARYHEGFVAFYWATMNMPVTSAEKEVKLYPYGTPKTNSWATFKSVFYTLSKTKPEPKKQPEEPKFQPKNYEYELKQIQIQ